MNPSRIFIERPVATSLLMLAILLAGLLAYRLLPLSALPEVDYPTIQVTTLYPGASPDVMSTTVTAPLERQFGQMPGLNQMTSTSSGGASLITLRFSLGLSLDVAEQEVQAAINAGANLLPSDLPVPPIYAKVNPADAPVLTIAITSPSLPVIQVHDLAENRLAPKLSQVDGVGLISIAGGRRRAVRIQANPQKLASLGLALDDVRRAIVAANVNQAKGSFDGGQRASTLDANDQLKSAAEYQNLIIAWNNGKPLRLSDVAQIVDDAENLRLAAWSDRTPGVILNVQRQPGANVIETVDRVKALLPKLQAGLPASVNVQIIADRTAFVPLQTFSLEGSSRKGLRHTYNKASKEGMAFRIASTEEVPALLSQLKQISDSWLAEKNTREKGFSLGAFDEIYLAHFPVALLEREGKILAFANLWTTGTKTELSIDLMRHLPEAPRSVMEYLFICLMLWGKEQGYQRFSLGMAPFSGLEAHVLAPLWAKLGAFLFRHGEHFYNFRGLREYKDKFDPVWEPKYLAGPRGLALPAILANTASLISGGLKGVISK